MTTANTMIIVNNNTSEYVTGPGGFLCFIGPEPVISGYTGSGYYMFDYIIQGERIGTFRIITLFISTLLI